MNTTQKLTTEELEGRLATARDQLDAVRAHHDRLAKEYADRVASDLGVTFGSAIRWQEPMDRRMTHRGSVWVVQRIYYDFGPTFVARRVAGTGVLAKGDGSNSVESYVLDRAEPLFDVVGRYDRDAERVIWAE